MVKTKFRFLKNGAENFSGRIDDYSKFVTENQLKNKELWGKFINVFKTRADATDNGWRGEYFGKMMRGACLTYKYRPDEELYEILAETVKNLIKTQDIDGRITTYPKDKEFNGWDLWVRKYVIVGCLYFYGICRDDKFKTEIISAIARHVDYLIEKIGDGEGQVSILDTSAWYGGLNSSSILEPIVETYKITGESKYLAFARYILSKGGCKGGNLIDLALKGEKMPFEYPEVKAYEMMSFFEGALAYYEVTGEERYFKAVTNFVSAVEKSDITIIGSAGCTHELFDNSSVKQADEVPDKTIMQETCVTVTWMRLLDRLLRLTGNARYADAIEKSAYNALYGSLNIFNEKQYCREEDRLLQGVTFDSYSPLVFQPRGIGIGGFRKFKDGSYYGCCACIGSAGTGLFPLDSVMRTDDGFVFNYYHEGAISVETPQGIPVGFEIMKDYVVDGECLIKVKTSQSVRLALSLRIPSWSEQSTVTINGENHTVGCGYNVIDRIWNDEDEIIVKTPAEIKAVELNGKTAFTFGAITLARDEGKENGDIATPFTPIYDDGKIVYKRLAAKRGEEVRFALKTKTGDVLLTDYASCGKRWNEKRNRISVWLNVKR